MVLEDVSGGGRRALLLLLRFLGEGVFALFAPLGGLGAGGGRRGGWSGGRWGWQLS